MDVRMDPSQFFSSLLLVLCLMYIVLYPSYNQAWVLAKAMDGAHMAFQYDRLGHGLLEAVAAASSRQRPNLLRPDGGWMGGRVEGKTF
jgi:hypothetical protein